MKKYFCGLLLSLWLINFGALQAQKPRLVIPAGQNTWLGDFQFTPNGRYLLTGSQDRSIVVWDMQAHKEVFTFREHQNPVSSIAVSPDNRTVVSGDQSGCILWWDLATGRLLKRAVNAHRSWVTASAFSASGRQLLTAAGGHVTTWSVPQRTASKSYHIHHLRILKTEFAADEKHFFNVAPGTSKLRKAANYSYVVPVADSFAAKAIGYYANTLFTSACLLRNSNRYAVVTEAPAEVRVSSLIPDQELKRLPLPGLIPFDVVLLDSANLLIAAFGSQNSLELLTYNPQKNQISHRRSLPLMAGWGHDAQMIVRIVPGSSGSRVAISSHYAMSVSEVSLQTGESKVLNPKRAHSLLYPLVDHNQLYLAGDDHRLKQWDLPNNALQTLADFKYNLCFEIKDKIGDSLILNAALGGNLIGDYLSSFWSLKNKRYDFFGSLPGVSWQQRVQYLSPDSLYTTYRCQNGNIELHMRRTGLFYATLPIGPGIGYNSAVWLNASTLASTTTEWDTTVVVYDVRLRKEKFRIGSTRPFRQLVGLPDNTLLTCQDGGLLQVYRLDTGTKVKEARLANVGFCAKASYVPALRSVLLSYADGRLLWLDPTTLQVRQTWPGHQAWLDGFTFNADRSRLYTTSCDGSVRIWNTATGRSLIGLSILDGQEWVAFSDDGHFDATPAAMKLMYYVVNDSTDLEEPWKIVALQQLKQRYYQPDLMRIQLGYSNGKLRESPRLDYVYLAPKVTARLTDSHTLTIGLRNQRGGIGPVSLYLDDAEVLTDARPTQHFNPNQQTLTLTIDLTRFSNRFYPGRPNELRVVAWNRDSWISAPPATVRFTPAARGQRGPHDVTSSQPKSANPPAHFYSLVVGTSDYAGTLADLRYASKDALDFAAVLRGAAERLHGTAATSVTLLQSEAPAAAGRPSRVALQSWFASQVGKVRPWDVLVIYLAGHGVNVGGEFYYLTQEAERADAEALADPAVRERCAVSTKELTLWLNRLSCRKKVLILDACAAGRAAEIMSVATRNVPASQVRALDRLAERTGFYILAGSSGDAISYESSLYGQGLLTYALLKALKGAALRPDGGEEYADVLRLLQYAVDEVPRLAQTIGGQQKPLYRSPDNQRSFDLGRVDARLKASIMLAEPKPMFVAASFQNTARLFDDQGLAECFNAHLREETARGRMAEALFTEARDYPGAYRVSGNYEYSGTRLRLHYVVVRGTQQVLAQRVFEADFSQPCTFATQFMAQLLPQLH